MMGYVRNLFTKLEGWYASYFQLNLDTCRRSKVPYHPADTGDTFRVLGLLVTQPVQGES